jgi:membrane-associated protease RseP (regulator of RpoE activity)
MDNNKTPAFDRIFYFLKEYSLNIFLFLMTFFTTTIAGIIWQNNPDFFELENFYIGLPYSLSLLFFLSSHEFGHYFASVHHKVKATLPYYLPIPVIPEFINFGTLGAVIKTKSRIKTTRAMFDIGAAGPIAGFIACTLILIWGFTHLPSIEYLYHIHPDYRVNGIPDNGLTFGNNLYYYLLSKLFVSGETFLPPMNEIYHYPFLCVGWFGLFVTALNLLPIGQLDGGHVLYAMFGYNKHKIIARITFVVLLILGLLGLVQLLDESLILGWPGWFVWAIVLYFVIKIEHPIVEENIEALDKNRMRIGYFTLLIFILSFLPIPIIFR